MTQSGSQQWFNFKFFESKPIKVPEVEKASATAVCFTRNYFVLCDSDGYVRVWDRAMRTSYGEFRAFNSCITHVKSIPSRNMLVLIGDDVGGWAMIVFDLDGVEAKDFQPSYQRYSLFTETHKAPTTMVPIRTNYNEEFRKSHRLVSREDGSRRPVLSIVSPIVSFDVSDDLTTFAAGLTTGEVLLLRCGVGVTLARATVGKNGTVFTRLPPPQKNQNVAPGALCFVGFANGRSGIAKEQYTNIDGYLFSHLLFVAYEGFAMQWRRDQKGEYVPSIFPMVVGALSPDGCAVNEEGELAIADRSTKGRIYFFNNENVTRLAEVDVGTVKIAFHKQYLVVLAQDTARKDAKFQICAYDPTAQIRALADAQAANPSWILSDVGQLILIHQREEKGSGGAGSASASDGSSVSQRVVRYSEIEFPAKLKQLFERECFDIAIRMAKKVDEVNGTTNEQMNIQRRYGEHLFRKGKYEESINQYIKTIGGSVEPSYVIRQFLDAQRIRYLTRYLEELHSERHRMANKNHTTLLLNCFTKMNERDKLREFINREDIRFDAYNAIKVCRQAGYYTEATQLAEKYQLHAEYVKIQLDNLRDPGRALRFIQSLPVNLAESIFLDHGKQLVALEPEATTDLLIKLCTKWVSANRRLATEGGRGGRGITSPNSAGGAGSKKGGDGGIPRLDERSYAHEFVHVFVDAPYFMLRFLEGVANCESGRGGGHKVIDDDFKNPQSELAIKQRVVYHTLIELYLTRDVRRSIKPSDGRSAGEGDVDAVSTPDRGTAPATTATGTSQGAAQYADPNAANVVASSSSSYAGQLDLAYAIITSYPARYDHYHVLALVQQHDFERGILYMLEVLNLHEEIVALYAKVFERRDLPVAQRLEAKDKLIEACKASASKGASSRSNSLMTRRRGESHLSAASGGDVGEGGDRLSASAQSGLDANDDAGRSIWVSLLSILVRSDLDVGDDIKTVLGHVQEKDLLPPVAVIEVLSSNPNIHLKTVRQYVLSMLAADDAAIRTNQQVLRQNTEQTARLSKELRQLTTSATVFQTSKCSSTRCGAPLDLPAVHFLCKHSYHKRCLNDVLECNECSAETRRLVQQQKDMEARADRHEEFFDKVAEAKAEEGFSVVAAHFADGIFSAPALRKEALLVGTGPGAFNADADVQIEAEDDWLGTNDLEDPASVEMW